MKIGSIGYNYVHDSSFIMDLPEGPGAWLFLLIKTPTRLMLDGECRIVREDFCLVLSPDTPCSYSAAEKEYTDDWFNFSADAADEERFRELGIPLNEVIPLGSIGELTQLTHILTCEHYSGETLHEEIEQHYLELLFLKLSRIIRSGLKLSCGSFSDKNMRLTHLRTRIYTDPCRIGSIDKLAAEAGMSRSGFQHAYKKMFGVSVMSDIVTGRIELAKRLLTSTPLTIEEIAVRCGYSSSFMLMRQFKQRCGLTPTGYRRGGKDEF